MLKIYGKLSEEMADRVGGILTRAIVVAATLIGIASIIAALGVALR